MITIHTIRDAGTLPSYPFDLPSYPFDWAEFHAWKRIDKCLQDYRFGSNIIGSKCIENEL